MGEECHKKAIYSSNARVIAYYSMKSLLLNQGIAFATLSSVLLPQATLALTPSQWFNQTIRQTTTSTQYKSQSTIDVEVVESFYNKLRKGNTGSVSMNLQLRTPKSAEGLLTSEGSLSFSKFKLSSVSEAFPISVSEPIGFEWKQTTDSAYLRITSIPATLIEQIQAFSQVDITGIIGKWIQVPVSEARFFDEAMVANTEADNLLNKGPLAKTTIITSVKQVKTWKNAQGEDIIRVTGRLNPAIAYVLYQERIKEIKKLYPIGTYRTMMLKDAYADYLKLRSGIKNTYLAANINKAQKTIERIEFSTKAIEPKKECTWNTDFTKETCKTVGTTTITVKGGINALKDTGEAVLAPSTYMTSSDLEAYFEEQMRQNYPESQPESIIESTTSTQQTF